MKTQAEDMQISEEGLEIIKSAEGYEKALPDGRCSAYQSYLGNGKYDIPTIGWGCTEGVKMGDVWTRDEAEAALRKELAKFEQGVTKLCTFTPTQGQFDALVSFSYNVGLGNLEKSTILKRANAGDFSGAAAAFAMWNKAQGVELAGLTRRRHAEAVLFLSHPDAPKGSPKSVDAPPPEEVADEGTAAPQGDLVDVALAHAEAHKDLLKSSWAYWANRLNIKTLVGGSAASLAFAKEYAIYICTAVVLAIVLFEAIQYLQRKRAIST